MLVSSESRSRRCLRTWCYLDEIDRDYDEFNLSRNDLLREHNVRRLPASTGIRAGTVPQRSRVRLRSLCLCSIPKGRTSM